MLLELYRVTYKLKKQQLKIHFAETSELNLFKSYLFSRNWDISRTEVRVFSFIIIKF